MNEVRDNRERTRYELLVDGEVAAFVQYTMRGGRLLLVHTEVDKSHAGRRDSRARSSGARSTTCACAASRWCRCVRSSTRFIQKHPEYDDLVDHEMFDAINAERQARE